MVVSLLLLSSFIFLLPEIPRAEAGWLDWGFRKSHVIVNATNAGTDYQVRIIGHYGSGTDSGEDVYFSENCRTDFGDIRFTDDDGSTELDYWMEQLTTSSNATFWVEIADNLSTTNATIYVYYGSASATTTSSGTDTWIKYEDNEGAGEYTWTAGAGDSTSLQPVVPSYGLHGTQSRRVWEFNGAGYQAAYAYAEIGGFSASIRARYWLRKDYIGGRTDTLLTFGEGSLDISNLNDLPTSMCDGAAAGTRRNDNFAYTAGTYVDAGTSTLEDTWYFYEILVNSTTSASYYFYDATQTLLDSAENVALDGFTEAEATVYFYAGTYYVPAYHAIAFFDTLCIGKYVYPEPAHAEWASVEGAPPSVGRAQILNMDYGNWVLTNYKYYTFWANYTDLSGYADITVAKIAFTDGITWVNASYNAVAETWTLDSGTGYAYLADGTASGSGSLLNVTFPIFLTNAIQNAFDVDLYLYVEDSESSSDGWNLTDADYFNIYNTGGEGGGGIEYDYAGDGYRVVGGCPFDVAAINGTAGSSARVNLYSANFQHFNTLVHLWQDAAWDATPGYWDCITEHNQTGYLEYGVDYYLSGAWVEGWKVRIEVLNASAGTFGASSDESYVVLNVSWYNRGSFVKSDTLVAMYEAYTSQDQTTQLTLWVDLWISNLEGSRMVAGHVSAQFYGMTETGWWLWADWGPIYGTLTSSAFMDYLQDANDNVTQASALYFFRVWSKLAKTAEGEGTDCDDDLWLTSHEICVDIRALPPTANLTGISSPVFQPTTTPDMPLGYFPTLANSIINVLLRIEDALVSGGTYIYSMATDTIDSMFEAGLGIPDFTTTIGSLVATFAANLADSVTYVTSLITTIFSLFTGIAAFIIDWFGRVVTVILQIATIVQAILDGTQTGIGALTDIWDLIDLEDWIDAVPLFMVIAWFVSIDNRGKRAGNWIGVFWGDINMIMAVFSFIFDMSLRVINLIIDWAARFVTFLFPL